MPETKTKPAPPKRAAKPRAPRPLDATAIRGALAQIADHGGNNTAILVALLEQGRGLKLTRKNGATTATMLGITATDSSPTSNGDLAALNRWANVARRRLLQEGAPPA
jgi:hypothetical protein